MVTVEKAVKLAIAHVTFANVMTHVNVEFTAYTIITSWFNFTDDDIRYPAIIYETNGI